MANDAAPEATPNDTEIQSSEDPVPDYDDPDLGRYESFDYTDQPFVDLSELAKNTLLELARQCARRDMASRRMEVEQAWESALFDRGYQYLFPRRGGGWQLFSASSGKTWSQMMGAQIYETNIYATYGEILNAALTRDIPNARFEPADPNSDPDVTAAEAAEEYKEVFAKNNDLRTLHAEVANLMCTDGRVCFYTTHQLNGQRFGFEQQRDETAVSPETEQDAVEAPKGKARGREIVEVYGKLSHKVPIQARDQSEMDFVVIFKDMDENRAKAMFPWIERKIKPSRGGVGEIGIDRIARINTKLALEGGYVTGDSFNREVTISYTWLRPASFYRIDRDDVRKEFFDNFPDGCLAVHAGETLAFCRNESMDDHIHILQALPGHGQNRRGLLSNLLSLQKRLNNWLDLLNDFFVRTVPTVWMDSDVFNVGGLAKQNNVPGQRRPFMSVPGRQIQEMIYAEPLPQHQPELPQFIQLFAQDFPQLLSGALPSLFGSESNTDTVGGISIQRDQALGRLGTPWGRVQAAAACYQRQAVQLAAKCRLARGEQKISWVGAESKKVTLEVADLKGNVLAFPEADANFPETWIQRSSRYQQLIVEAPNTPMVQAIMNIPENLRIAKDAIGLKDLVVPQADAVDKQRGEFEVLLKGKTAAPLPNPQIQQIQDALQQGQQESMQQGPEAYAQFQQLAPQLQQQLQNLPPYISSCPVAQDASELHSVEAQTCLDMMNSPLGRRLKHGNPQQKKAFENLHLHWQEHTAMVAKLTPPMDQQNSRPISKSVSVAVDKMPNPIAAQLLQQEYGVQATPDDFGERQAADTEQDITKKAADFGRGTTAPAPAQPPGQQVM